MMNIHRKRKICLDLERNILLPKVKVNYASNVNENCRRCTFVSFQSNEEGLRKCLQVLSLLATKDSSKLTDYKIANIQHNIQNVSICQS